MAGFGAAHGRAERRLPAQAVEPGIAGEGRQAEESVLHDFGEDRQGLVEGASVGRLYQAIRETRGMNYGNYSYIEAFPAGYATQQPRVNVARRSQLFEIWIRPISLTAPDNLHDRTLFAIRAGLFELQKLVDKGMTPDAVKGSREFLRNYVSTWGTTIGRRLGYAVDDEFYAVRKPGFLASLRARIDNTTPAQVNAAIRMHLRDDHFYLVVITANAEAFKKKLLSGEASSITYAGQRPAELLAEDKRIAAFPIRVNCDDYVSRVPNRNNRVCARFPIVPVTLCYAGL